MSTAVAFEVGFGRNFQQTRGSEQIAGSWHRSGNSLMVQQPCRMGRRPDAKAASRYLAQLADGVEEACGAVYMQSATDLITVPGHHVRAIRALRAAVVHARRPARSAGRAQR